jgi:hypothetical protein
MPFSLSNALAIFQNYINDVLEYYLDHIYTISLDNILIYSDNFKEQQQYIYLVRDSSAKAGLHLKPKKAKFYQ